MTAVKNGKIELLTPEKNERNMGVELFRIVSMMLVILLHVLGHGGVLSYSKHLSANYKAAWFLETIGYCSVNCYALISGFANVKTKFKFRRMINLWLETVVLTLAMTAIAYFFIPSMQVDSEWWIIAVFPLTRRALWYLCAYFFMFPLIPILNKGLLSLSRRQHLLVMLWLQVPTVFRLIVHGDNYSMGSGYSAIWLICLYVMGAYFRIYGAPKWAKWFVTLPVFFIAAYIAWDRKIDLETQFKQKLIEETSVEYEHRGDLISYISPCMVIMAVMLLLFFMQIKIRFKPTKIIIANFAKATWGVFVLHVCNAGWYWNDVWHIFRKFPSYSTRKMVGCVFLAVLLIFLAASIFTLGKIYLFKLLRVEKGINYIADIPGKIIAKKEKEKAKKEAQKEKSKINHRKKRK